MPGRNRRDALTLWTMVGAVTQAMDRKRCLIAVLRQHGHAHAADRSERWLALYQDWLDELVRRHADAVKATTRATFERLLDCVPMAPRDSLDQESTRPADAVTTAEYLALMDDAELKAKAGPRPDPHRERP